MDPKMFIPDFNAIAKTNWQKPTFDKNNVVALVILAAFALMFISLFFPWFKMGSEDKSYTLGGFSQWYGIVGFLFIIVGVASVLYQHKALALWAAVICVILGIIGMTSWPSITEEGITISGELVKESYETAKKFGAEVSVSRIGAVIFFIGSLVASCGSFLFVTGKKLGK